VGFGCQTFLGRAYIPTKSLSSTLPQIETKVGVSIMKKYILAGFLAATVVSTVVSMPAAFADEAAPHHYVKDSVITTKVKAKLAAKHLTTLTRVKVDTDENGVVWLSGHAPTQDAVDMAGLIAKGTEGVTSVHNDVVVQPK
jgi:hyperosmotically inducible periplasmic protein